MMNLTSKWLLLACLSCVWSHAVRSDEPSSNRQPGNDDGRNIAAENAPVGQRPLTYWLQQLQSDQYLARQAASYKILEFGDQAVPPLVELTKSGQLESSERALSILQGLAERQEPDDEEGAYGALVMIAEKNPNSSAARARAALQSLGIERTRYAYETLMLAGTKIGYQEFVLDNRAINANLVRIDSSWKGDASTLRWLKWIKLAGYVIIEGPAVNREVLEHVVRMPDLHTLSLRDATLDSDIFEPLSKLNRINQLEFRYVNLTASDAEKIAKLPIRIQLNLMGTNLDADSNAMLHEKLAGLKVDIKQGGFLGVQCSSFAPFCQIDRIVPGGSAEEAGILAGDIVEQIDDVKIQNFTDLQAEIGTHGADKELTIHLDRRGQKMIVKVKLKRLAND